MNKKLFAQRLRQCRELKKITQKNFASALGIGERNYQYYEAQEDARMPSISGLINIADNLDVSVDYILGRTDNPKTNK